MKSISISIALMILLALSVHDTKLDTMTKFAIALPIIIASLEGSHATLLRSEAHTHVERVSVGQMAGRATSWTPMLARRTEDSQYKLAKSIPKGHHPFDNYSLPLVS